MAQLIHERITGSRLLARPDAAHCSPVERAEESDRALLGFLEGR